MPLPNEADRDRDRNSDSASDEAETSITPFSNHTPLPPSGHPLFTTKYNSFEKLYFKL